MKKEGYTKLVGLSAGALFSLATSTAFAAENAAGVKEHMGLMLKTVTEAQSHAAQGHGDLCVDSIKQSIQHYKELTGDAAGKTLQDAVKKIKLAKDGCQAGDTGEAASLLQETVPVLEKINNNLK